MPSQAISFHAAHTEYKAGNFAKAAEICKTLLASGRGVPDALNLLAIIEVDNGNLEHGVSLLDKSLAANSAQPTAHCNRAFALAKLERHEEALASYDRAISLKPDYLKANSQRAKLLVAMQKPEQALAQFDEIIRLMPENAEAYASRGNLLKHLDRNVDALASYDAALRHNPGLPEVHNNRGKVLRDLGRYAEALASYDRAIALRPNYATAQTNKSLILLLTERFAEGWQLFEWRWKGAKNERARKFLKPLWLGGGDLRGKRLFVWSEQGLGDLIQFCRFIPLLLALGCRVVIEVPKALIPLIGTLGSDFDIVEKGNKQIGEFDFHCPLMSLPLALDIDLSNLPAPICYLATLPERRTVWRQRLGPLKTLRVGLAWSGSPTHNNDLNRSMRLQVLAPLFDLPIEFHVVQKGVRPEDENSLASFSIQSHESDLNDFADTAALVESLDLVLSVDTSLAHLAGALGKEVWIMLAHVPDYRWLLEREDCPWYPTARLFRQPDIGDWRSVVEQIKSALLQRIL